MQGNEILKQVYKISNIFSYLSLKILYIAVGIKYFSIFFIIINAFINVIYTNCNNNNFKQVTKLFERY